MPKYPRHDLRENENVKRRRIESNSGDDSDSANDPYFLRNLRMYILPTGIGNSRRKVLQNLIEKHGGTVVHSVTDSTTHVLVDETVSSANICRTLGWATYPPHVSVVMVGWLSSSIRANCCIDITEFEIPCTHKPTFINSYSNSLPQSAGSTSQTPENVQENEIHVVASTSGPVDDHEMTNDDHVEDEASTYDDFNYEDETTCDDEWLFTVKPEPTLFGLFNLIAAREASQATATSQSSLSNSSCVVNNLANTSNTNSLPHPLNDSQELSSEQRHTNIVHALPGPSTSFEHSNNDGSYKFINNSLSNEQPNIHKPSKLCYIRKSSFRASKSVTDSGTKSNENKPSTSTTFVETDSKNITEAVAENISSTSYVSNSVLSEIAKSDIAAVSPSIQAKSESSNVQCNEVDVIQCGSTVSSSVSVSSLNADSVSFPEMTNISSTCLMTEAEKLHKPDSSSDIMHKAKVSNLYTDQHKILNHLSENIAFEYSKQNEVSSTDISHFVQSQAEECDMERELDEDSLSHSNITFCALSVVAAEDHEKEPDMKDTEISELSSQIDVTSSLHSHHSDSYMFENSNTVADVLKTLMDKVSSNIENSSQSNSTSFDMLPSSSTISFEFTKELSDETVSKVGEETSHLRVSSDHNQPTSVLCKTVSSSPVHIAVHYTSTLESGVSKPCSISHPESSSSHHTSCLSDNLPSSSFQPKSPVPGPSTQRYDEAQPSCSFQIYPNTLIVSKLQMLYETYKRMGQKWRVHAYEKAIIAVRSQKKPILTIEDIQSLNGVGKKISAKIWEVIETGHIEVIDEICSWQRASTMQLFTKAWGIGPFLAASLYREGHRTLHDLRTKSNVSRAIQVGLRYFHDLRSKMPRREAEKILSTVLSRVFDLYPFVQCDACSSLRRNKKYCGHVDILVTLPEGHVNNHKVLPEVVARLHQEGFLIDDLIRHEENGRQTRYVGIFKLKFQRAKHRRLDITVCTIDEYACALMHLTGPAYFNRAIRQIAKNRNMILNEHALSTIVVNEDTASATNTQTLTILKTPNEAAIFTYLDLPFRIPEQRERCSSN